MDASLVMTVRDNAAIIPPLNGTNNNSVSDDYGAKASSLNLTSSGGNSNGNSSGLSRHQQLKLVNGLAANGVQSMRMSASQTNSARLRKAAAGVELKSKIIEFMRDRPYLWNKGHPGYNDNKRRENEFSLFSQHIGYPIPEIKRVWHVLRTNFFRAHKIQADKEPNGGQANRGVKTERCWKYYQSMKFILNGLQINKTKEEALVVAAGNGNNASMPMNEDSSSSVKDVRQTRSSKVLKVARGSKRLVQKLANQSSTSHTSDSSNNSSSVPSALLLIPPTIATTTAISTTSTPSVSMASDSNVTFSSNQSRSVKVNHNDDHETTGIITNISSDQLSLAQGRPSTFSSFNGCGMSRISFDTDDDHLYARSLTATLKKFDPTTKEVIKLKFQEIIVEYMQKQQQQQQLQPYQN